MEVTRFGLWAPMSPTRTHARLQGEHFYLTICFNFVVFAGAYEKLCI